MSLYELTQTYQRLAELAEVAEQEGSEEAQAALAEAFDLLDGEATDKLDNCAGLIQHWQQMINNMDDEMKRLRARIQAYEGKAKRLSDMMLTLMDAADLKKAEGARFTVSKRQGRERVIITGADKIPEDCMLPPKPQAPTPDKKTILAKWKAGMPVIGTVIERGPTTIAIK